MLLKGGEMERRIEFNNFYKFEKLKLIMNIESVLGPPEHPFSDEIEKEREMQRTEELKPILDELNYWRYKSLYALVII